MALEHGHGRHASHVSHSSTVSSGRQFSLTLTHRAFQTHQVHDISMHCNRTFTPRVQTRVFYPSPPPPHCTTELCLTIREISCHTKHRPTRRQKCQQANNADDDSEKEARKRGAARCLFQLLRHRMMMVTAEDTRGWERARTINGTKRTPRNQR
jgi:hypothetical protein